MEIRQASSQLSFSQMMAQKQSAGERKFAGLRSLSDFDREALNDSMSDACGRIAAKIGKGRPFVPGVRA